MSKKIKVIQLLEVYGEEYQSYIPPILHGLKQKSELDILIYTSKPCESKDVISFPHYKVRKILTKYHHWIKNETYNYELIEFLKKDADIIHVQHSFLFGKVTRVLNKPRNERPKIVITLRGADTYLKPWINKKWKSFYEEFGNKIDAFVTVSQHQKDYLTKWGVEADRIHVIPISFGNTTSSVPKFPSEDVIKIISAHRMTWEKNIDGNLRTVKALVEKGQKVIYDIYGDGPDAAQVYYLIDKYNLSDSVFFKGKIDNKLYKEKLSTYDFFLQLSHSESFGASVIEAQSKGVPAIISNSDGIPETIINKKTGYCFNPWDVELASEAILNLKGNKDLYFSFSKDAINNTESKFSNQIEVDKLVNLYKDLLKDNY